MKQIEGFSLVESLVVMAIIAILAAMGVPTFSRMIEQTSLHTSQSDMFASIQLARSTAIMAATRSTICPSSDGQTCGDDWSSGWIVFVDHNLDDNPSTAELLARHERLPAGIQLRVSQSRRRIRFQATGTAAGSTATFSLCNASHHGVGVVLANSGRPRMSKSIDCT
jgi:type IV fimbrial biogenesis protein FimT